MDQQGHAPPRGAGSVTRRSFLRAAVGVSGLMLLSACAPTPPPAPTAAPAKPAEAPKPTTSTGSGQAEAAKPAAPAKPAEAPKPTEAPKPAAEAPKPAAAPAAPAPKPAGLTDASLRVATTGESPTLDWHFTTVAATFSLAWNIYETLVALDREFNTKPMLADSWEISPDGLTYTFKLRRGVRFHNDKEMKAEDVVASLNRWGELSQAAATFKPRLTSLVAKDDYTVEIKLNRRYASLLVTLAQFSQAAAIMPKEVVEKAGKEKSTEFIGTGPYRFEEWKPDVHIKLTRYDGYKPRSEEKSALAGALVPYIKDVYFVGQPDRSARLSALLAGDVDIAKELSLDQLNTLKSRPGVTAQVQQIYYYPYIGFNFREAPSNDLKFRQAVAAAVDSKAIMEPLAPPEFWKLHPTFQALSRWATDAGKDVYNQNNPAKAKQLLVESGYAGQPVAILTNRDNPVTDKSAQVLAQQLKNVGVNIVLEANDTATYVSRRGKPEGWGIFQSASFALPDPGNHPFFSGRFDGGFNSPAVNALRDQFQEEVAFEAQYKMWEKIETQVWSELPMIKTGGDLVGLHGLRDNVTGWDTYVDLIIPGLRKA